MVRKSEAMARESLRWWERGQANRTRNPELCFYGREEETRADSWAVPRREGAGSKRRGDSEGSLGRPVNVGYILSCVANLKRPACPACH